jgi:hypothetical protein
MEQTTMTRANTPLRTNRRPALQLRCAELFGCWIRSRRPFKRQPAG